MRSLANERRHLGDARRDRARAVGRRHAVVGDDHQVRRLSQRAQALHQPADLGIDVGHRLCRRGRLRTIGMAGAVDRVEIQRHDTLHL